MATVVKSMATSGVDGFMVEIEASTIRGQQQSMSIIGLPDQAVKEAGERIQAAIEACGYDIPKDITILSLAPGDKRKRGSQFDLLLRCLSPLNFYKQNNSPLQSIVVSV